MSFVPTPNSFGSALQKSASPAFLTDGITDPVVQQNFEILIKYFSANGGVAKANLVIGPAYATGVGKQFNGTTTTQTPGALQVQISTAGNPVRVKIAPFVYSGVYPSSFALSAVGQSYCEGFFGWQRIANGKTTTISTAVVRADAFTGGLTTLVGTVIPLPAFEFDDVVPAGLYTYQFFFFLLDANTSLTIWNINAVAYELR